MRLQSPKNYKQQISKLKNKNIIIADESVAREILQSVNYYRLKGYLLPFIDKSQKKCFSPIPIEQLRAIYEFDSDLRNLIASIIEDIEVYLRGSFSYYHAQKYGSEGYMDANNFNLRHNHVKFKKRVNSCISENSNSSVVKHHQNKYNGHFSIWVVNYQTLESWLRCLTDLRNRCAHYARLYYWIFPALPKIPQSEKYIHTRRLFAQLYTLKMLYPDHDKWNKKFVKPLIKLVKKYKSYISMQHLDFPYRWKSMLLYK